MPSLHRHVFHLAAIACLAAARAGTVHAEDLTFNGNGTVRILASDWAKFSAGAATFSGRNGDGGIYWRGTAGDGQYIHFDLSRLQGLTLLSPATVTLQNTNSTWGGGVDGSFIATANGPWAAAVGAPIPGATAIGGATNPTGTYGSGTSVAWGIGAPAFQGYVDNAASFKGFAIIGGEGSQLHFDSPMNPSLSVATNAAMNGVVTVAGGAAWNASNYSFTDGVLTINSPLTDGASGAGNVTINSLGTVFVNSSSNYNLVDSTRINAGGMLKGYGAAEIRNLTLAGGVLAGNRDQWQGGIRLGGVTTVTGGVTSTISAEDYHLGNVTIDAGSTLNLTGQTNVGTMSPTIEAGGRLVYGVAGGASHHDLQQVTLNGGELAATSQPDVDRGNYTLYNTVTVGGTSMSIISADVRVMDNASFNVADVDSGSGVDLLLTGKIGAYGGIGNAYFIRKNGAGTMKITEVTGDLGGRVGGGRLILQDAAVEGSWGAGGLFNDAILDFSVSGSRTFGHVVPGSGSLNKSGTGTVTLTGSNTFTGDTTVSNGALIVASSGQLYGDQMYFENPTAVVTVAAGATLGLNTWDRNAAGGLGNLGFGPNRLVINGGTIEMSGSTSGGRNIGIGAGGATLRASGTAGQVWTIAADSRIDLGTLTNNTGLTLDGLGTGVIGKEIVGTGALTKSGSGTWTLSALNDYQGGTVLNGGRLVAGNAGAFGRGAISVGSGATIDLGGFAVENSITNNGGSVVNASSYNGTQAVVGATSLTGTVGGSVIVNAGGTLRGSDTTFNGAVAIGTGGAHSPGNSPGTQTFAGGLAYSGSSSLTWELIANTTSSPGTNYDFLSVTNGNLTIDSGALLSLEFLNTGATASSVSWANAFWDTARTWTIIDFTGSGSSTGIFTLAGNPSTWLDSGSTSLAAARSGASFSVANVNGDVVLSYAVAVPEPSSFALAGLGGLLFAAAAYRRRLRPMLDNTRMGSQAHGGNT